jgi:hypothetical protein
MEPFSPKDYSLLPESSGSEDNIDNENDEDKYLMGIFSKMDVYDFPENRCPGPDADTLLFGYNQQFNPDVTDECVRSLEELSIAPTHDEKILSSCPERVIRPIALRLGFKILPPGTPLSERSITASLEDGSSSVASYSTLQSSIMSSPDSSKLANIMASIDKSAFRSKKVKGLFVNVEDSLLYTSV